MRVLCILIILILTNNVCLSSDYDINFIKVSNGVWYAKGKQEERSKENGGAIANIGLIVGNNYSLVIDSGPTKKYSQKLIKKIKEITKLPIKYLILTHRHFDHSFGFESFHADGAEVIIHNSEYIALRRDGPSFVNTLSSDIGKSWTEGTLDRIEELEVTKLQNDLKVDLGDREVKIINFENAHTSGDLGVLDIKSKAFFSGDLVFINRAATIPNANIRKWIKTIDNIKALDWEYLIPGHGNMIRKKNRLSDTKNWLLFIDNLLLDSINNGDSLAEILTRKIPKDFNNLKFSLPTISRDLGRQLKKYEFNKISN